MFTVSICKELCTVVDSVIIYIILSMRAVRAIVDLVFDGPLAPYYACTFIFNSDVKSSCNFHGYK